MRRVRGSSFVHREAAPFLLWVAGVSPRYVVTATSPSNCHGLYSGVLNRSGGAATATVHGMFAPQAGFNASGMASDYTVAVATIPAACTGSPLSCSCGTGNSCKCDTPGFSGVPRCEVPVTNLAPGPWIHDISVSAPATGQKQFRQSLLVSDPAKANVIEANQAYDWTVFKTAYAVTSAADSGSGTLRNRINTANATDPTARPVLIRFDHGAAAFMGGEVDINVTGNLTVTANDTVIDGTNPTGDPSPVAGFKNRIYRTKVNLTGTAKFEVSAPNITLMGLQISRALGPDSGLVGADLDQVHFSTTSKNSRVRTCRLDGGAAARVNADCATGSNPAQGKDCVDAENTGATSFAEAIIVEDSELRHCYDRPAKSQDGYLILRDNWIHNNLRGGPFAQAGQTPAPGGVGSHLKTERNLLEHNGKNCPTAMICSGGSRGGQPCAPAQGCPGGSDDGCPSGACIANPSFSGDPASCGTTATRPQAAQISAEQAATPGTYAELQTDGDVLRNGLRDGIFLQQNAYGQINNAFICGMTTQGMEINSDTGSTQIGILGSANVFSGYGALLHASGSSVGNVNFGSGGTFGKNAFAKNPSRNFFVVATVT